ncbi:MAG TPA: hypothetical protein VGS13_15660 [Stellaceae bacterium]|nr:hypothetical protein [Stellaceae bacterium]
MNIFGRVWQGITEIGKAGWIITILVLVISGIGLRYTISIYNSQNHPTLKAINFRVDSDGLVEWTIINIGNEDATTLEFNLYDLNRETKMRTPLTTVTWARLRPGQYDVIKFTVRRAATNYFLYCASYNGKREHFSDEDFYMLSGEPPAYSLSDPQRPPRSAYDDLMTVFSCAKR